MKYKWITLLSAIFMMIGLTSCEQDPLQQRNYLLEPFVIDKLQLSGQEFNTDSSSAVFVIEEVQTNKQVGFIYKEDIEADHINQISFELTLAIDPKRYDVEFESGEVVVMYADLTDNTHPVSMQLINTREEREHVFLTFKVSSNQLEQSIAKEDFRHASFQMKANYKEKKGKKKTEPRSFRFMVYTKS